MLKAMVVWDEMVALTKVVSNCDHPDLVCINLDKYSPSLQNTIQRENVYVGQCLSPSHTFLLSGEFELRSEWTVPADNTCNACVLMRFKNSLAVKIHSMIRFLVLDILVLTKRINA